VVLLLPLPLLILLLVMLLVLLLLSVHLLGMATVAVKNFPAHSMAPLLMTQCSVPNWLFKIGGSRPPRTSRPGFGPRGQMTMSRKMQRSSRLSKIRRTVRFLS
jgi:hypothetical protein